jgi:hypothetical protein
VKDNQSASKPLGRRHTLQLLGAGLAVGGLFGVSGCNKEQGSSGGSSTQGASEKGGGCKTPVDEAGKTQRRTLQYVEKAVDPQKKCSDCAQYVEAQYAPCGGCKVVPGPIKPEGGCLAFAPKTAAPAASSG